MAPFHGVFDASVVFTQRRALARAKSGGKASPLLAALVRPGVAVPGRADLILTRRPRRKVLARLKLPRWKPR